MKDKPGGRAAKRPGPPPRRTTRTWNVYLKAFVWVLLTIFVLTSVGVALVVVR